MNLNKEHRQDFVKAVMAEVPMINYKLLIESAMLNDVANAGADANTKRGAEIKVALKSEALRPMILNGQCSFTALDFYTKSGRRGDEIPCINGHFNFTENRYSDSVRVTTYNGFQPSPAGIAEVVGLCLKMQAQYEEREEMSQRLTTMIGSCKTRKQAVAMFPELEKYLPKEVKKENFPIVASNIVADLVKAGWPASKAVAA